MTRYSLTRGECPRCVRYRKRNGHARPAVMGDLRHVVPAVGGGQWKDRDAKKPWHRAERWYTELGACERCSIAPAIDRHHVNGDPRDNYRDNLMFLCRRCHLEIDGRMEHIRSLQPPPRPTKTCIDCGKVYKPMRRGRCAACDMRARRQAHG